ncbi:YihY/virulence factor BrkB family protein [Streptomyces sp. NPDC093586]|uniref:YihY/virulence factor BrkB family protein n=1 Tax=Streptomyces sp. NPDC093586 TaxID=3366042 RepID=UPI0037FC0A65
MEALRRFDAFQRRHRWCGMPLGVVYKFADDQGMYLAALIAFYGFLSLFPLLLLLVSLLAALLQGDPALQEQVLESALRKFPVLGDQLKQNIHSFRSNGVALAAGVIGSLYGGLGVAQAVQTALNKVWAVPRYTRPNPLLSRVRGLMFIGLLAMGLLATTGVSAAASFTRIFGFDVGGGLRTGAVLAVVLLNAALLVMTVRILTPARIGARHLWGPAVGGACAWQALQWGGTYYVRNYLNGASATYGMFGIVLGLLAWLYLAAVVFVLTLETSAVRAHRLWPRSLLTPFTDNVRLTDADRRAYRSYAVTESFKGFQKVTVEFHGRPFPETGGTSGAASAGGLEAPDDGGDGSRRGPDAG